MVNIKTNAKNLSTYSSTREKPNLAIKYYHGVVIYLFTYFFIRVLVLHPKKKEKRKKNLQRKGW